MAYTDLPGKTRAKISKQINETEAESAARHAFNRALAAAERAVCWHSQGDTSHYLQDLANAERHMRDALTASAPLTLEQFNDGLALVAVLAGQRNVLAAHPLALSLLAAQRLARGIAIGDVVAWRAAREMANGLRTLDAQLAACPTETAAGIRALLATRDISWRIPPDLPLAAHRAFRLAA